MNKTKSQLNHQLSRAIQRSEKAYSEYIGEKKYYQAFRIKRANEVLYNLLEEYLFYCEKSEVEETLQFIFHIEDWRNQFDLLEKQIINLDEVFAFKRFENAPAYPKTFAEKLKKKSL
ncbi:MAG TPA: hypothetical protein VK021_05505 [Flavobacteriaceae bacterium]|nr:hypothetical protein [Flavobacteriaceae bacterium]